MKTKENNIEVTCQEAWITTLRLSVMFIFNDVELQASCLRYTETIENQINDSQLENIEVMSIDDPGVYFTDGDEEHKVGKRLLEEMDLDRYLTF